MVWLDGLPANSDHESEVPLYRQLFEQIATRIRSGDFSAGERLPATRELAGLLGLNRTTVSAAYEMLEAEGLICGTGGPRQLRHRRRRTAAGVDWSRLLERADACRRRRLRGSAARRSASRCRGLRATCFRWTSSAPVATRCSRAAISPTSCSSARRAATNRCGGICWPRRARKASAGPGDDLMITNGCQQALDLIGRVLLRPGDTVAVEDPVYPGLKNLLTGMGAQLCGIPVGPDGMDVAQLERVLSASGRASWW